MFNLVLLPVLFLRLNVSNVKFFFFLVKSKLNILDTCMYNKCQQSRSNVSLSSRYVKVFSDSSLGSMGKCSLLCLRESIFIYRGWHRDSNSQNGALLAWKPVHQCDC